jgi:hypothetical protein
MMTRNKLILDMIAMVPVEYPPNTASQWWSTLSKIAIVVGGRLDRMKECIDLLWRVGTTSRVLLLVNVARKTICYWVLLDMTIPCNLLQSKRHGVFDSLSIYQGTLQKSGPKKFPTFKGPEPVLITKQ